MKKYINKCKDKKKIQNCVYALPKSLFFTYEQSSTYEKKRRACIQNYNIVTQKTKNNNCYVQFSFCKLTIHYYI